MKGRRPNTLESILARVEKVETCGVLPAGSPGCWLWTGSLDRKGYGTVSWEARLQKVHRVVYSLLSASIPSGCHVHHTCEVKRCCNPAHLEVKSRQAHVDAHQSNREAKIASRTHCKHGHELTLENTSVDDQGRRHCRQCGVQKSLRWAARNPEKRQAYLKDYSKEYREKNREKLQAYVQENKERIAARVREYGKRRVVTAEQRARKAALQRQRRQEGRQAGPEV